MNLKFSIKEHIDMALFQHLYDSLYRTLDSRVVREMQINLYDPLRVEMGRKISSVIEDNLPSKS